MLILTGAYSLVWPQLHNLTVGMSVQFSSVTQLCPTLCNPMNRSMPGLPVHHQLPEFTQTLVHGVSDAIQPSHPLVLNLVTPGEFFKFFFFGERPSKVLQMKELQFRVEF